MTDIADALIVSARRSLALADEQPIEARRALSCAYYAVYHGLAKSFADALIGEDPQNRPQRAWVEAYRGLDHATCAQACKAAVAHGVGFPEGLITVAGEFEQLQKTRHLADYDPRIDQITTAMAEVAIETATDCLTAIRETPLNDILAFATWVLISSKGAKEVRNAIYHRTPVSAQIPSQKAKKPNRPKKRKR